MRSSPLLAAAVAALGYGFVSAARAATIDFTALPAQDVSVLSVDGVNVTAQKDGQPALVSVLPGGAGLGLKGGVIDGLETGEVLFVDFVGYLANQVRFQPTSIADFDTDGALNETVLEAFGIGGKALGTANVSGTLPIDVSAAFGNVPIAAFRILASDGFTIASLEHLVGPIEVGTMTPGQRVFGYLSSLNDSASATFHSVPGMKLLLNFPAQEPSQRLRLRVLTPSFVEEAAYLVELGVKAVQVQHKLAETGLYTLRVDPVDAITGAFFFDSTRTLPPSASKLKKVLKPAKGQTSSSITFPVLPDALLFQAKLKPGKNFTGPLSVNLSNSFGAAFDLDGFTSPLPNGGLGLGNVPLGAGGVITMNVGGFGNKKQRVKLQLTITPPPLGTGDVAMQ